VGTGLDALTHAVEAFTSRFSSPVSDALALEAIGLISAHLPAAAGHPRDSTARDGMMLGSLMAGLAISSTDTASVHCLSETIGGVYDAPHGMLNGILLPYVMAHNIPACPDRFARIANAMGKSADPESAVSAVVELNRELKVPSLHQLGVRRNDIPELARLSERHSCNVANPRSMEESDYVELLERSIEGKSPLTKGAG
jgi:alcohol dehydrogenase